MKKIYFTIIFFTSLNILNGQCDNCLKQVELLGEQLKGHVLGLNEVQKQKDSLIIKTKIIENELQEYKLGLKLPFNLKKPEITKQVIIETLPQPVTTTSIKPNSAKHNQGNLSDNSEINKLKNRILQLNKEIGSLRNTIKTKTLDEKKLLKRISALNDTVSHYKNQVRILAERNKVLQSSLECIDKFIKESKIPEEEALYKLNQNRDKFIRYKNFEKNLQSDREKMKSLMYEILETYKGYNGAMRTAKCGDIELSYYCDFLTIADYQNIAEIYGKNLSGAVFMLDSDDPINESNRIVLDAAGKIMEYGNYDDRTHISNNLAKYITEERKAGTPLTEVRQNFSRVHSLYNQKKYLEALLLYDKYQKFLSDPELDLQVRNKAVFSVGVILLWDLANTKNNLSNLSLGDWSTSGTNYTNTGKILLQDVISQVRTSSDIRKKASIALAKYYE